MPRSGNPFFPVINLMLVPFGLFGTFVGAAVLISGEGGEMWWLFAGFLLSGVLMLGGVVSNLVKWWRWQRDENAAVASMAAAARARSADPAAPLPAPVMAHWTYEPGEWSTFATREVAHRGGEAFWMFVGVVVIGTLMLAWDTGDWLTSFGLALLLGAIIGGGKWLIARSAHTQNVATSRGEVVITPTAVLMNGRYEVLHDHHFRFLGAHILEDEQPRILALSVDWPTRSGRVSETYRIPIPAGREDEARKVAQELVEGYAALKNGGIFLG
jgi:hypothetical protein